VRQQEQVARYVRPLVGACLVAVLWTITVNGTGPLPADPGRGCLVLKLAPAFATRVEQRLALEGGDSLEASTGDSTLGSFLERYGARRLRPLHAASFGQRHRARLTEAEWVGRVRQRFASRAARAGRQAAAPDLSRTYILDVPQGGTHDLEAVVAALRADRSVEWAEVDRVVSVALLPNDPFYSSAGTWGQAYDDLWGLKKIGAGTAWDTTTGAGTVVAVVDTGLDFTHPDLAANAWTNDDEIPGNGVDDDGNGYVDDVRGWDFVGATHLAPTPDNDPTDGNGHGTHVAGTVAAVGNNGVGVVGVAWGARVMAVKGLDDGGTGYSSLLASAIRYAADNGADVINNSWGAQGDSAVVADAIEYAASLGVVVVAAAGNSNEDAATFYPARYPRAIAVAATDRSDYKATFSNWGSRIDVAAPGVDILSLRATGTILGGTAVGTAYARADGTSMASPHVAGVCALLLAQHPDWSAEQVRQALRVSASDLYPTGPDLDFGYGRLDAAAAVALDGVLESRILSPADGTRLHAATAVEGLARGAAFASYRLEFGVGSQPTSWTLLQQGSSPVDGTLLGTFDPSLASDSYVTLRLTAVDSAGRNFVDRVRVVVDFATIESPAPPRVPNLAQVLKPGAPVAVLGKAMGPGFQGYHLEWARGVNPGSGWSSAGITLGGGGTAPVSGGELGAWDTSGITQADFYTIRLVVNDASFSSESRTLVYLEPDLASPNWPRWLPEAPGGGSGVVPWRDASGATRLSVVVPSWGGANVSPRLYSFPADGSTRSEAPLYYGAYPQPAAANLDGQAGDELVVAEANSLRVFRPDGSSFVLSPDRAENFQFALVQLADLDGDGAQEILAFGRNLATGTADLFAWRSNGQLLGGQFPILVTNQNWGAEQTYAPRSLVADLDGDGGKDIVLIDGVSPSSFTVRAYTGLGVGRATWGSPAFAGSPRQMAVADIDRDGVAEVVILAVSNYVPTVHLLRADGTEAPGWPRVLASGSFYYLAVGDLDLNGRDEILVAVGGRVYALNGDGTALSPGWPYQKPNNFNSFGPMALADVNGDGFPEVLAARYDLAGAPYPQPSGRGQGTRTSVQRAGDGTLSARITAAPPRAASEPALTWADTTLVALDRTGTIVRSWRVLGANGNQPDFEVKPTAGDFDGDGRLDIALTWQNIRGGGSSGNLGEGVLTVLATGVPAIASDWPSIFHDTRNSASGVRPDALPPAVSLTSPTAGTVISGPVSVTASASDDAGLAGVTFLLDGVAIGPEDTWPPFSITWDARLATTGAHQLVAVARDSGHRTTSSSPVAVTVVRDSIVPSATIVAPQEGATVAGFVSVHVSAADDRAVTKVELWVDGLLRTSATSGPWVLTWNAAADAPGTHTLVAKVYDQALNVSASAPVTVNLVSARAVYDSVRRAPRCANAANLCDSADLLAGRGTLGPEPNASNTIGGTCADSTVGTYHADESLDRLRLLTVDGSRMRPGKQVIVEATVWAPNYYFATDALDIYVADNAASPVWTLVSTLTPAGPGLQTLRTAFALSGGPLQAVRGQFRPGGGPAVSPCQAYNYADRDDLIFTVAQSSDAPVASTGGPYHGTRGVPLVFDGAGSWDPDGDPLTYAWDFGDGSTGTGATPPHTYAATGTYTVSLVVSDGQASSSPATGTVTITSGTPVANAGGPYAGTRLAPVTLSGAGSSDPDGDPLTYLWNFGDGGTGTGVSPTHLYAATGVFTVTLTVSDGSTASTPAATTVTITNLAPAVTVTSPAAGTVFTAPATVTVTAVAGDPDGTVSRVDFFANGGAIGTSAAAPCSVTWAAPSSGSYALTAVVTDNAGATAASAPVSVVVNARPSVVLTSPANLAQVAAPATLTLTASAADGDGTIARVEFFRGTTSLGVDTTSPYSVTWTNAPFGSYSLTAVATDNRGATTTSAPVTVKVTSELLPTGDAYVQSSSQNSNYGTAATLTVQQTSSDQRWTYVKIDLSGASVISGARLRLYGAVSATTTAAIQTAVYAVGDTSWTETGIKWKNKPAAGTTALATTAIVNNSLTPRWYEWDVTAFLQAEKAAGRTVVSLALKNVATATPYVGFSSREGTVVANRPRVVIVP
jgi:subtilisin family serine protease/PKD repeat protein